jgi:glycerophosphoryl diester phosphodiesterase
MKRYFCVLFISLFFLLNFCVFGADFEREDEFINILGKYYSILDIENQALNEDLQNHIGIIDNIISFSNKKIKDGSLDNIKKEALLDDIDILVEYKNNIGAFSISRNIKEDLESSGLTQQKLISIYEVCPGFITIVAYNLKEDRIYNNIVIIDKKFDISKWPGILPSRSQNAGSRYQRNDFSDFLVIAHRGISIGPDRINCREKGNKMSDFEDAISRGVEWIELDLRRTRDGKIILFHDSSISIPFNVDTKKFEKLGGYLHNHSNSTSNKTMIKFSSYESIKYLISQIYGYEVDLYENALKKLQGRVKLDIELKESGYEKEVVEIARKYFSYDDFMICTFWKNAMKGVKKFDPKVSTALLMGDFFIPYYAIISSLSDIFPEKYISKLRPDFIIPNVRLANLGYYDKADRIGIKVIVWDVDDDSKKVKKLLSNPYIHGFVTDYPVFVNKMIKEF